MSKYHGILNNIKLVNHEIQYSFHKENELQNKVKQFKRKSVINVRHKSKRSTIPYSRKPDKRSIVRWLKTVKIQSIKAELLDPEYLRPLCNRFRSSDFCSKFQIDENEMREMISDEKTNKKIELQILEYLKANSLIFNDKSGWNSELDWMLEKEKGGIMKETTTARRKKNKKNDGYMFMSQPHPLRLDRLARIRQRKRSKMIRSQVPRKGRNLMTLQKDLDLKDIGLIKRKRKCLVFSSGITPKRKISSFSENREKIPRLAVCYKIESKEKKKKKKKKKNRRKIKSGSNWSVKSRMQMHVYTKKRNQMNRDGSLGFNDLISTPNVLRNEVRKAFL